MEFDFFEMTRHLERVGTARLALRPTTLSDAWPLFEATRNPRFNRHLAWTAPETIDPMLARMESIVQAARFGTMSAFSAVCRETGAFVGVLRYMRHDFRADALEMGVWVSDRYWHGRVAQELGALALTAAFELTPVARLCGMARPENRSSCALMAGLGMVAQPRLGAYPLEAGGEVAVREYVMSRDEWAARDWRGFEYYGLNQRLVSRGGRGAVVADAGVDDSPPRVPEARRLALEALRAAAATAAVTAAMGAHAAPVPPSPDDAAAALASMPAIDAAALDVADPTPEVDRDAPDGRTAVPASAVGLDAK